MTPEPITRLLRLMADGDDEAGRKLFSVLYTDLRARAGRLMRRDAQHTLQPTAVVNEAWLKLSGNESSDWTSRGHFLGVAAKAMRSVLVDHARAKKTEKRGGDVRHVPLDDALKVYEGSSVDMIALDDALEEMARKDPELARLVELRFFSGLTIPETAEVMGSSTATIERSWRTARSVLRVKLNPGSDDEH